MFDRPAVGVDRKLKIKRRFHPVQFPDMGADHRSRILGPENETVDQVGRERYSAYLMRVHRIADQRIPVLQTIEKPIAVERRNIRSSTCTDNQ